MEEKKVNKNEENVDGNAVLILAIGAFVLGSIVGASTANKRISEAYNKGVMDTFQALILKR